MANAVLFDKPFKLKLTVYIANHIMIAAFQIRRGGVQIMKRVTVQILVDLTVSLCVLPYIIIISLVRL